MKNSLIYIVCCLLFICCDKQNSELSKVDIFINTLKENKVEKVEAVDFELDDISDLLEYRKEQSNSSNFPRNPLSSFYMEEVSIGMYVLWTIESLRMKAINDPNFYLFASLNPRVIRVDTNELPNQNRMLPEVAKAYFDWWNTNLSLEEKLQINPLEELNLRWN